MSKIRDYAKALLKKVPRKYILLESIPDVSDNTKAVFDEMLRRKLNEKYKIVWLCKGKVKEYPKVRNVRYCFPNVRWYDSIIWDWCLTRTKLAICSNSFLVPTSAGDNLFCLNHGTTIKNISEYYTPPDKLKHFLGASDTSANVIAEQFHIPRKMVTGLGFPRNDEFALPTLDLHSYFSDRSFKKIIAWYPTFRQSVIGRLTGATHALPVIWDERCAEDLNSCARDNEVLIVLKPHFAQDVTKIKTMALSNLVFIDDSFFEQNGIVSYRFLGSCDALLTDYSSIYFDFTLCDKPIGLIWEDYEEYAANPGFAVDMDEAMKGGVKIFTLEDLKAFVQSVGAGEDHLQKERRAIRDKYNYSTDGKNSKRVVEYIIETFNL